jgi:hypothetical protein
LRFEIHVQHGGQEFQVRFGQERQRDVNKVVAGRFLLSLDKLSQTLIGKALCVEWRRDHSE